MKKMILFIHGMFLNPVSWEKWVWFFEQRGYDCREPAWPAHEGEPADLRKNIPAHLGELSLTDVVARFEEIASAQPSPPILIGHSVGGLIVQLLVNRGLAEAGVCLNSVAPNAMVSLDWDFLKNSSSIANPLKGHQPCLMTEEHFCRAFAYPMSRTEARQAYEAYAVHDSRKVFRDCMGKAGHVDLDKPHAPLLFIGGSEDRIIPEHLNERNAHAYTDAGSVCDFREFAGRGHFTPGQSGWEEVAAFVAGWLAGHTEPLEATARSSADWTSAGEGRE